MSRRGFSIGHQKLCLAFDFSGRIKGYAELIIQPEAANLKTLYLNCRQCRILRVTLPTEPDLSFTLVDPLESSSSNPTFLPSKPDDFRASFPELKRKFYSAVNEADQGELAITLPESAIKRSRAGTADPATPSASIETPAFEPIVLTIEYEVNDPTEGVRFVGKDGSAIPQIYTYASAGDAARCWMPCIDTLWDRSSWELQLIVPRHLALVADSMLPEAGPSSETIEELPVLAVASGELVEQIVHPKDSTKVIFRYSQPSPTSAQHIGFAIGPFHILDLCPPAVEDAPVADDGHAKLHAFCMPGQEEELLHSVSFVRHALDFYVNDYGSYPFGSYKLVFIDDAQNTAGEGLIHNTATMTTFPADLLHPPSVIEQGFETRQVLAAALASQWVGVNIIQKTWADTWLINGIALHLAALFLKKLLGVNEYRFRLKKDVIRCCQQDVTMPPICEPGVDRPPENDVLSFVNLKAPLVLFILNQKLLKTGTSHGLPRVLSKIFLSAISGELKDGLLSTSQFFKVCRKVSSADLRLFSEQWVYRSGCPLFDVRAVFNRKKMAIEMSISQECPAYAHSCRDDVPWQEVSQCWPVDYFEGQLTIRVHEADGTPYEHVLDVKHPPPGHVGPYTQNYNVPFNTKYKRVRRQTKKIQARAEAAKAKGNDQVEEIDELFMIDMFHNTNILEDEKDRREWRVVDWSEEDEERMAQATYEWIRLDADFEWICTLQFDQPDYMWISQLQRDRDTVAQLEAVRALSMVPTRVVASTLIRCILNHNYFFRIRTEAILALAMMAVPQLDNIGLFYLAKLYAAYCYDQTAGELTDFSMSPRPNDFHNMTEYFMQLSILTAMSHIRTAKGEALPQVTRFFIHLLTYNDNSANAYSDSTYIVTIFQALSHSLVAVAHPDVSELFVEDGPPTGTQALVIAAYQEISRYMSMDRLVPSYRNCVTSAGTEWKAKMMLADLIPVDLRMFFAYSREENYTAVRVAALDALLLVKGFADPVVTSYVLALLSQDTSEVVRMHLAEAVIQCLALIAILDEAGFEREEGLVVEEENATAAKEKKKSFSAERAIDALRWEFAEYPPMQLAIKEMLCDPTTPLPVRLAAFKLCETLYEAGNEPVPRLKFKLPKAAPPVQKPALPRINLKLSEPAAAAVGAERFPAREDSPDQPLRMTLSMPDPNHPKKPKKHKSLRSQASGMSLEDVKACRICLSKIVNDKNSRVFRSPVDPKRDSAPNYFEIVTDPMDLMTMSANLENGKYQSRDNFRRDFKLMVANAQKYNGENSVVGEMAKSLDAKFNRQWARIDNTLQQAMSLKRSNGGTITLKSSANKAAKGDLTLTSSSNKPALKIKLSSLGSSQTSSAVDKPTMPPPPLPRPTLKLSFGGRSSASLASTDASTPKPKKVTYADEILEAPLPKLPPPALPDPGILNRPALGGMMGSQRPPQNGVVPNPVGAASSLPASVQAVAPDVIPSQTISPSHVVPTISESTNGMRRGSPMLSNGSPAVDSPLIKSESQRSTPVPSDITSARSSPEQPLYTEPLPQRPLPKLSLKLGRAPSASTVARSVTPQRETPKASATPQPDADPNDLNIDRAKTVLLRIFNMSQAGWFRKPVDPVESGCPTYYDVITDPMDLGTMLTKLEAELYESRNDVDKDFALIISNCHAFNPPGSLPVQYVDDLDRAWRASGFGTTIPPLPSLSAAEKKALGSALKDLSKLDLQICGGLFQMAVDPIKLGIPHYYDVIPRSDARDLSLIKNKLNLGAYRSIQGFEDDFALMLKNALTFNAQGTGAHALAMNYKRHFEARMEAVHSQLASTAGTKRSGSSLSGTSKKARLSS